MWGATAFAQSSPQTPDNDGTSFYTTQVSQDGFDRAFRALKRQDQLQFELTAQPPIKRSKWLDEFLNALVKFFATLGPLFKIIFWLLVVGIAGVIFYIIGTTLMGVRFNKTSRQKTKNEAAHLYQPSRKQALILLEQVDALAAQGAYVDAVHILLFKSIQDISIARPNIIKRSYTSREITGLEPLSLATRDAFALITREVERSHFGGRDLDKDAFLRCRQAYAQFAIEPPTTITSELPQGTLPPQGLTT